MAIIVKLWEIFMNVTFLQDHRGPVVCTLCHDLSAESRGAGSIPVRVLISVSILNGVVFCNFDEGL